MIYQEVQVGDVVKFTGIKSTVVARHRNGINFLIGWKGDEQPYGSAWNINARQSDVAECNEKIANLAQYDWGYWVNSSDLILVSHAQQAKQVHKDLHCSKCHDHFPYAEPNQANGTLVCWNCRNYPHYQGRLVG